jgi:uncharacterized protein YjiS (DUF1127 family)
MNRLIERTPLETMLGRPLPPVSAALFHLARRVLIWEQRRQTRHAMARLDAHMIRDIGLTPGAVENEVAKPFWRD